MAGLAAFRASVVDALTAAGVPAKDHVPERWTPPVALVLPRTPYVDPADAGTCAYWCRLRVVLIGGRGTNAVAADDLDDRIARVLVATDAIDAEVESVQEPVEVEMNGAAYLGTVVLLAGLVEME